MLLGERFQVCPTPCSDCSWVSDAQSLHTALVTSRVDCDPRRALLGGLFSWFSLWNFCLLYHFAYFYLYQGVLRILLITFTKISALFNNVLWHEILHALFHTKSFSSGRAIKLFVFKACLSLGQNLYGTAQELKTETVAWFSQSDTSADRYVLGNPWEHGAVFLSLLAPRVKSLTYKISWAETFGSLPFDQPAIPG